jgi:hypothetical protein
MTVFVPTTTVTIERDNGSVPGTGTHVEGYGPLTADWQPVATGLPAYVYEDDQRTWDPATGRLSIRTVSMLRMRPSTDLQDRDRVVDDRTGHVFQVDTVNHEPAVVGLADVRATLVRIDA